MGCIVMRFSDYKNPFDFQLRWVLPKAVEGHEGEFVLVGYVPFNLSGIAVDGVLIPELMIPPGYLKSNIRLTAFVSYYICDDVQPNAYTIPFDICPSVRLPTIERAIVDYIRLNEESYCPDYFADSFSRYLNETMYDVGNLSKLREVASHFNVPWSTIAEYIRDYYGYNNLGNNTGWEVVANS